jgi:hypothetical protein
MKNIFQSTKTFIRMAKDISQYSKIKKIFTPENNVETVVEVIVEQPVAVEEPIVEEPRVVLESEKPVEVVAEPKVKKTRAPRKKVVKETTEEPKAKKVKKKNA